MLLHHSLVFHLSGDWMPALCSLVQALPSMKPHWDFRLWLTTVPTQDFPAVILQVRGWWIAQTILLADMHVQTQAS
jgi:hypothetical protein